MSFYLRKISAHVSCRSSSRSLKSPATTLRAEVSSAVTRVPEALAVVEASPAGTGTMLSAELDKDAEDNLSDTAQYVPS